MKAEFWHERWEKGEIGFHQHDFNQYMQEFIDRLEIQPGARILVPLCGKSLDMLWLVKHGYRVTGIEISELAVQAFFHENKLDYEVSAEAMAIVYRSGNLEIRCQDFFDVQSEALSPVDAVYDRASLIALPPDMRSLYAARLTGLIEKGVRSLLVTLHYPQHEMNGPPFSVSTDEVSMLFNQYRIELLHSEDCLANEPRFLKKGLTRLDEYVFILQKME